MQFIKRVLPKSIRDLLKPLYAYYLRQTRYRGKAVECPFCGGQFGSFAPVIYELSGQSIPNEQCPQCGALSRQRLYWLYFQRETRLLTDQLAVLHFAPFEGFKSYFKRQLHLAPYVSTDLMVGGIDVFADIQTLPFADNTFDVLICTHVLEHVPDDKRAMRELYRVLKPNGWALLQVPLDETRQHTYEDASITQPKERLQHFGQEDHARIYGQDYATRLTQAGFQVERIPYRQHFSPAEQERYGLSHETLYICHK